MFLKNGRDVCARMGGFGASTYRFCASPFLKEFCVARLRCVLHLNPARFLCSKKEAPPLPPAAHSFSEFPPPKNQNGNERQGQWAATRGTPRVAGLSPRTRIVPRWFASPRARSATSVARNTFAQRLELRHKLRSRNL